MKTIDAASELCTLVFAGDLPLLKRYISAGIEVHIVCVISKILAHSMTLLDA